MLKWGMRAKRTAKKKRKRRCHKKWRPNEEYKANLSKMIRGRPDPKEPIETRIAFIEKSLLEAMGDEDEGVENPKGKCDHKPCEQSAYASQLTALISERKGLKHSGASRDETRRERVRLGKEIQKVIKLKQAAEKSARMAKILGEFSDLKELAELSKGQREKIENSNQGQRGQC